MLPTNSRITGRVFGISFHTDWKVDNGFSNRLIMMCTQTLVHRWAPEQVFQSCFTDRLNQSLVSSVVQAKYLLPTQRLGRAVEIMTRKFYAFATFYSGF